MSVTGYTKYKVKLIHRYNDWDATLQYLAPTAPTARKWALNKMSNPDDWIIVSARRVKETP